MGSNLLINGVYWGYNPVTNLLPTSWDIYAILIYIFLRLPTHQCMLALAESWFDFFLCKATGDSHTWKCKYYKGAAPTSHGTGKGRGKEQAASCSQRHEHKDHFLKFMKQKMWKNRLVNQKKVFLAKVSGSFFYSFTAVSF